MVGQTCYNTGNGAARLHGRDEMSDLTTKVLVEIRDEIKNVKAEVRNLRNEHGEILREHGDRLEAVDHQGTKNGIILRQILGAVEYGNKQRDVQVGDLENRVARIEQHLDLPPSLE